MRNTNPGNRYAPVYELIHEDGLDDPRQTGTVDVQQMYDSANTGKSPKDLIRNAVNIGQDISLHSGEDVDMSMLPDDPVAWRQVVDKRKQLDDLFASQPIEVRRACDFDVLKFLDFMTQQQGGDSSESRNASSANED